MSRPPVFTDREGVLLAASLIVRATAKGYTPEVVRKALASTNAEEFNQMVRLGVADDAATAAAGMAAGALEGIADILEGSSKMGDEGWLKVVHAVYAQVEAEDASTSSR